MSALAKISTEALRQELLSRVRSLDEKARGATRLQTPAAIAEYLRPLMAGLKVEEFHAIYVNSRNVVLGHEVVAAGSVDSCHVDPRAVLAPAVTLKATGLIIAHNHPSGDPEPSVQDVALTKQLRDGARLLCVRLLDHVIVGGDGKYVSLLSRDLISR